MRGLYCWLYRKLLQLTKKLRKAGLNVFEDDIQPPERYLMERFITAPVTFEMKEGHTGLSVPSELKPTENYRPKLKLVSLDIETSAQGELYSVALEGCGQRQVYMLGSALNHEQSQKATLNFKLEYCVSCDQLLKQLNAWFANHYPDGIIGWNLVQFDLRILQQHLEQFNIPLTWGRDGSVMEWRRHSQKQNHYFANITGRLIIDGIETLRFANWTFPSYSLEDVAQTLLGEGKTIGNPYDRIKEIQWRFYNDKPALAAYNLKDCELVNRIFDKTELLSFLLERATVTGLPADRSHGSVAAFTHLYLPRMHRLGYIAPNLGDIPPKSSPGCFVMDSKPGLFDSVLVLDYKSLYPFYYLHFPD